MNLGNLASPWLLCLAFVACDGATGSDSLPETHPASGPAARFAPDKFPMTRDVAALYRRPPAGSEPKIRFESETLRFGEVAQGGESRAVFTFVNDGPGALAIFAIRPHCGCMVGSVQVAGKPYDLGGAIARGVKGSIEVVFRANSVEGERDLDVDILTNDVSRGATQGAEFGEVQLKLTADVVRFFEWEGGAAAVDLGRFVSLTRQKKSVILTNTKKVPFEVVSIQGAGAGVATSAAAESDDKSRWRIDISTENSLPLGVLTRRLSVKTRGSHPMAGIGAELFVTGTVRGTVDVIPSLGLRFLVIPRGTSKVLTVTLVNESGKPWSVGNPRWVDPQSASLDPPGKWRRIPETLTSHVKLEQIAVKENYQVDFRVTVDEGMPAGGFSMVLAVDTGLDDGPATLLIPAMGVVR